MYHLRINMTLDVVLNMIQSKKDIVGISIIGPDREGVIAAFIDFVFELGGNVEKTNQNVIKGLFGMYLEASFTKRIEPKEFDEKIRRLASEYGMEVSVHYESNHQKNIAIMVTKEPLCLEIILNNLESLDGKISVIIGTEKTLEYLAKQYDIPFVSIRDRSQPKAESKILKVCKKYDIDLIVLARYMRILTPNFVWRYPNHIINIHPSLLPAFPGASAYEQAYERGTKIVGVTAHYVSEDLDQGPIILQDSFTVDPDDTLDDLKTNGQQLEARTLLRATKLHLSNRLEVRWRKVHERKTR